MRNLLRRAGKILSALALGVAVFAALATIVAPRILGATPYTVLTASMRPAMDPGTLAIVRPVDARDIRVGDVLTYQVAPGRPEVVTHRVVGVISRSDGAGAFRTRGDANSHHDPDPVVPAQIRGRVIYAVPWLGHLNSAITSSTRHDALVIGAGGLVAYGLWQVIAGLNQRRITTHAS